MKRVFLVAVITAFLTAAGQIKSSAQNSKHPGYREGETIQLFNGSNLNGWYTFLKEHGRNNDPKKVFTVKGGKIRISGEEWGCITTNKEYENYHLVTEFKWGKIAFEPRKTKARDCGVLLNSQGEDGAKSGTWMYSIECQVIEGGTGDFIIVGDGSDNFRLTSTVAPEKQGSSYVFMPGGKEVTINSGHINWFGHDPDWKDEFGFRGKNSVEKPAGKWNKLECIVVDGEITVYLNDVLVNKATNVKPRKGRIQIQSEGAEIYFRKVELTPLSKK